MMLVGKNDAEVATQIKNWESKSLMQEIIHRISFLKSKHASCNNGQSTIYCMSTNQFGRVICHVNHPSQPITGAIMPRFDQNNMAAVIDELTNVFQRVSQSLNSASKQQFLHLLGVFGDGVDAESVIQPRHVYQYMETVQPIQVDNAFVDKHLYQLCQNIAIEDTESRLFLSLALFLSVRCGPAPRPRDWISLCSTSLLSRGGNWYLMLHVQKTCSSVLKSSWMLDRFTSKLLFVYFAMFHRQPIVNTIASTCDVTTQLNSLIKCRSGLHWMTMPLYRVVVSVMLRHFIKSHMQVHQSLIDANITQMALQQGHTRATSDGTSYANANNALLDIHLQQSAHNWQSQILGLIFSPHDNDKIVMWRKNQFDLKFKLIEKQFDEVTSTFDDDKKNKFKEGLCAIKNVLNNRRITVIHHPCGFGKLSYVAMLQPLCRLESVNEFNNDHLQNKTTYILLIVPMKAINIGHSQSFIFQKMNIKYLIWTDRVSNDMSEYDVCMICPETLSTQSFQAFFNGGSNCTLVIVDELMTMFVQSSFRPALRSFARMLYAKVPLLCLSGSVAHVLRKPRLLHAMFRLDSFINAAGITQSDESSSVVTSSKQFDIQVLASIGQNNVNDTIYSCIQEFDLFTQESDCGSKPAVTKQNKIMIFANTKTNAINIYNHLKSLFKIPNQVGIIYSGNLKDFDLFCNDDQMNILVTTSVASYGVSPPQCDMIIILHSHSVDQMWQSINRSNRFAGCAIPKIRILYVPTMFNAEYGMAKSSRRKQIDNQQISSLLSSLQLTSNEQKNLQDIYTSSSYETFCTSKTCRKVYLAQLFHPTIIISECKMCDICNNVPRLSIAHQQQQTQQQQQQMQIVNHHVVDKQNQETDEYEQIDECDSLSEHYESIWTLIYFSINQFCFFCKRNQCQDNTFNENKYYLCAARVKYEARFFNGENILCNDMSIIDGMYQVDTKIRGKICVICQAPTCEHGQSLCTSLHKTFNNSTNQPQQLQICFICYKPNVNLETHTCDAMKQNSRIAKQRFHTLFRYVYLYKQSSKQSYSEVCKNYRQFYREVQINTVKSVLDNGWIASVCEDNALFNQHV
jgi:hypothetical protein